MKSLLVLSNASTYGGGERSLEAILPPLAARYRVRVIVENARHLAHVGKHAGPTLSVSALPGGRGLGPLMRDWAEVWRLARRMRPDVLVANTNKGALFAALLRASVPFPPPALFFVRDFQWHNRRTILRLARGPRIVVPSPAVTEHAYWAGLLDGFTTSVIPNAVAAGGLEAAPPAGEPSVLCLANFGRWKGIHLLIEAFAQSEPHAAKMRLYIAGNVHDRAYFAECKSLVRACGVEGLVTFAPFADDPARLFAQCSLVAVPSISKYGGPETFSRTVIEAWAHGKPVVAFAVGGPKYLIRDGVDGLLVPEGNVAALAAALRRLGSDPALAAQLGRAGRLRAQAEFSAEGIAARVSEVIEALTGGDA